MALLDSPHTPLSSNQTGFPHSLDGRFPIAESQMSGSLGNLIMVQQHDNSSSWVPRVEGGGGPWTKELLGFCTIIVCISVRHVLFTPLTLAFWFNYDILSEALLLFVGFYICPSMVSTAVPVPFVRQRVLTKGHCQFMASWLGLQPFPPTQDNWATCTRCTPQQEDTLNIFRKCWGFQSLYNIYKEMCQVFLQVQKQQQIWGGMTWKLWFLLYEFHNVF